MADVSRRSSLLAFVLSLFGVKSSAAPAVIALPVERRPITILIGNSSHEWQDGKGWVFAGKLNMENHWSRFVDTTIEPYEPTADPSRGGTEMERRNMAIKAADEYLASKHYPDYKPKRT